MRDRYRQVVYFRGKAGSRAYLRTIRQVTQGPDGQVTGLVQYGHRGLVPVVQDPQFGYWKLVEQGEKNDLTGG